MSDSDPRDYRSLGDLLRDARKERKLSYEQVNEATKISPRVLAALEKDDLEGASGPIYARGFVRTLAKFYDLDADWLGAKLDQLAGETSRPVLPVDDDDGDVIAGPLADPVREEPREPATPKWEVESTRVRKVGSTGGPKVSRSVVVGALAAVLVVAIALVWFLGRGAEPRRQGSRQGDTGAVELAALDEDPGPASTVDTLITPADTTTVEPPTRVRIDVPRSAVETIDTARPAGAEARNAAGNADAKTRPDPVPAEAEPESGPDRTPDRVAAPAGRTTTPPQDTVPAEEGQPGAGDAAADPVAEEAPESTATPTPEPPAETVEREGAADEDRPGLPSVVRPSDEPAQSWAELRVVASAGVEVTIAADGGPAETRRLAAGEAWSLRGSDHFSLAVSDPSAVRLEMNGTPQEIPRTWTGEERILYPPQSGQ